MQSNLRELRAQANLSQAELADQLGVSRQTVNAIETQRYDPSLELAIRIARLFKTTVEEVFHVE
jgi:putative transcriptional regulator